ncbi:MAG: HAMP domain-containing histidine kinase [Deltaproteobacteria bacterium]|nr:HAMP domain-containing histidine kinase [Deltaproteobacteria bacterium]
MTEAPPPSRARRLLRVVARQAVRLRTRLLLVNLLVVLIPAVGLEWARTYEREGLRALETDMLHQAQLLRTLLEHLPPADGALPFRTVAPALAVAAQRTRLRLRLVDRMGRVTADSHEQGPPEGAEPAVPRLLGRSSQPTRHHTATDPGPIAERVEIRQALAGRLGTATRVHQRIGRVFLFLALPVRQGSAVAGAVYVTRSTVPVLQSLYRLRRQLVTVLVVALGLSSLLSLFLAATISGPIARLNDAAGRLARGDRTAVLQLRRGDEIGQLSRSVDTLVRQLDHRATYVAEFAANISHELKTPLASIRGAAELLLDGAAEDASARERFLRMIASDVERLDRLVSRVLELSRIEAPTAEREGLDLSALVREVASAFPRCPLELVVPDALPYRGHRAQLVSALTALVENAVRHSPADAPVVVALRRAGSRVELSVQDHGQGIADDQQTRIFDRFFTTRAAEGGTGLGLAIVAAVAEGHGGAVRLTSAPGAGACFTVELPAPD